MEIPPLYALASRVCAGKTRKKLECLVGRDDGNCVGRCRSVEMGVKENTGQGGVREFM